MYAYSRIEYEMEMMDEFIEKEMQRLKNQVLADVSPSVHFDTLTFIKILHHAWADSQADAFKLADQLNLGKLEFLAVLEEFEEFKEEYLRDCEKAENF